MTTTDKLIVAGVLLSALSVAFAVLRVEVRRLRRPAPPRSVPVQLRRFEDTPTLQMFDVLSVRRPMRIVSHRQRGGRHVAAR